MSDRELLELAAKAAGLEFMWEEFRYSGLALEGRPRARVSGDMAFTLWNPLTDDGDALRLAAKLLITVGDDAQSVRSMAFAYSRHNDLLRQYEPSQNDPAAAYRRAIVRAAAEIGRTM